MQQQQVERWRGTPAERGYDKDWVKVRLIVMRRDAYLCQACLRAERVTPATDCDHIIPFVGIDDPRRLDPNNCEALCRSCHNIKTAAQQCKRTP